jgi:Tol biopolymer transport system component
MKVDVDKNGQAKNKEPVLITDALPNYGQMYDGMGDMFPSPDGNKIFAPFMTEGPSFFVYDIPSGETNGIHLGDFVFFLGWNSNSRNIIWGDDYRGVWQTDVKGEHKSPLLAKIHGKYERIISAAVSPNGKQIVYTHTVFNAYATELWMIDDDGKNDRKIMDAHTAVSDLAWSPDGQKIAFWYYSGYWVMNADGSNPHQIVEMPSRRGRLPILWSPDSKMLLVDWGNFVDNMMLDFTYSNIFVLDVESGESRTLLPDGSKGHLFPAWSPDGQKIAFISTRAGKPDVWVINRDGTGLHQVTHDRREIRFLFWRKP